MPPGSTWKRSRNAPPVWSGTWLTGRTGLDNSRSWRIIGAHDGGSRPLLGGHLGNPGSYLMEGAAMARRGVTYVTLVIWSLVGVCLLAVLAVGPASLIGAQEAAVRAPVRVGVYDGRAIAVAWAASEHMRALHEQVSAEMAEAEAAGDEERIAELGHRMQILQRKLHFQGFGEYPVHEMLSDVEDLLPGAAERAGVDVIVPRCDYHADHVTVVDVTLELVKLLDHSERAAKSVDELKNVDLVPFGELIDMAGPPFG